MNTEIQGVHYRAKWKLGRGSRLTKFPTALDIVAIDNEPLPVVLLKPGDLEPAPRIIPYDRYIDEKFVDAEVEHIWKKQWQVACREEDIPNIGDRINYDIVDNSYLVVRAGEREFKAFHNSCRHRARKLCDGKRSGPSIYCAFHGWEYGLDGKLQWVPYEEDFPHVDAAHNSLIPVQVATWGGNVFINPDPRAKPLELALGPLVEHYKNYSIGDRYTTSRVLIEVECNWKAAQEAFMEGYHVLGTHADALPYVNSVATQIDIWSDGLGYVSRLFTPAVIPDSWIDGRMSSRECLVQYCDAYELPPPPEGRGDNQADARRYVAEVRRKRLVETTGKDWSKEPTTYFMDQAKYFLFPNHHPFWGEGSPRWLNFKPLGRNPDRCEMEIRTLLPIPASGKRPPVPEPHRVRLGERVKTRPEMGRSAHLLDQDLDNMCAVQLGFKAAAKGSAYLTLSKYHEAKIRRFHEIYDEVLGIQGDA